MSDWKELKNELYKFEQEGEAITGIYLGSRQGKYSEIAIIDAHGLGIINLPQNVVLHDLLSQVGIGDLLRITYQGKKLGERGYYDYFRVEVKKNGSANEPVSVPASNA